MLVFSVEKMLNKATNSLANIFICFLDNAYEAPFTKLMWKGNASQLAEVSHDEAKWNDRRETSAGFRRVSYHARARFLNNQWHFCHVRHSKRTGLNLSGSASGCWIWARAKILNGPIRVEDETTLRAAVVADTITSLWGKPKRRILRQMFRSSFVD